MPTRPKVIRGAQRAAALAETQLARAKREYFQGCAKIPLRDLDFTHSSARDLNEANIKRLLTSFELTGCQRIDAQHHVPAVLDLRLLRAALREAGASADDLQSDDPTRWPVLTLAAGVHIECLHGQHRIVAARKYLSNSDQWWVVDLYSSALTPELRAHLIEQTANEMPLTAGEIYFHILRCDPDDVEEINRWLALIQTENGRKEVQLLLARKKLNESFRPLAGMPALGASMQVGNIRALMGIKCDEEILHSLSHIYRTWMFLLDDNQAALAMVDHRTVERLQSRCPANCRQDRDWLQPMFEDGSVFRAFDPASRREIWQRLLTLRRLVPSLETFFHDLKYLKDIASCVTMLIQPTQRQTIREACRQSFLTSEHTSQTPGPVDFDHAYREFWLLAMHYLDDLRPGSLLREGCDRIERRRKNFYIEHDFAREVRHLGFWSAKIAEKLEEAPDRREARETLLRARPSSHFTYLPEQFENLVDRIIHIFNQAQPANIPTQTPQLIIEGPGECDIERRRGRPYQRAFEQSAPYLSMHNMHMADSSHTGGLSAFYIRRDVYLSLFGCSDGQTGERAPSDCDMSSDHGAIANSSPAAPDHVNESTALMLRSERRRLYSPASSATTGPEERAEPVEPQLQVTYSASHYSQEQSHYTVISTSP
ncbi:hypothetical protein LTS08_008609 [Lithohypha guttulata]|uniref:uncharacterized protein n=1 Tax=Lithohypha guttulata TaxID=1690604 RepID=UPI002DE02E46|nr:hypothetical protein LTS08_008609 [Lithohypha guttulata]